MMLVCRNNSSNCMLLWDGDCSRDVVRRIASMAVGPFVADTFDVDCISF